MKNTIIIFTLLISGLYLLNCTGSAEKRDKPKTSGVTDINSAVAPQSNVQNVGNTAVKREDDHSDDKSLSNLPVKKDADDVRQTVSNAKRADTDDTRKKGDADDRRNANTRRDTDDKGKHESDEDDDN